MSDSVVFHISVPLDEGFAGRQCPELDCGRYFKVHIDSVTDAMFCPHCGRSRAVEDFLTEEQLQFVTEAGLELARKLAFDLVDKQFGDLTRKMRGNRNVKFTHTPIKYRPKTVEPQYSERKVDSEVHCSNCGFIFQVYGIFGHCPGCATENVAIYDANLEIIRQRVLNDGHHTRELRHAYDDLVSTFEYICKSRARHIVGNVPDFRNWSETRKFFKDHRGIDIFDGFIPKEMLTVRRLFEKRNTFEHNRGEISEIYVRRIPEDKKLLGTQAQLSWEELVAASQILRVALDRLPLPPK